VNVNPYAPPSAAVTDPVEPPIPRPRRVTVAMLLLCLGGLLGVTVAIIQHREPFVGQIAYPLGVTAGICIAIAARRNWARWAFSALIGAAWLRLIEYLLVYPLMPSTFDQALTLATDAVELVAVIILFTGPSNRWFKQPRPGTR
jgi:hypothetical protein